MLGHRHGDAVDVDLLKAVRANLCPGHVVGNGDDGRRIHVCRGKPSEQVGRPRAGGRKAHADFAAGPGIAVRRVGGVLLVGAERVTNFRTGVQRFVDAQNRAARVAEHITDALLFQTLYDDLRAGFFTLLSSCFFLPNPDSLAFSLS